MIKGKVVRLEILNSDDDSLEFYLEVGKETLNVHNLTDHFLGVKIDDIRDEFNLAYNDLESDDFLRLSSGKHTERAGYAYFYPSDGGRRQ